ncbi:MAG: FecR family protein [Pirellulales bacterium]|nr:FecR family protein [Pirellulales bacterium]
MNDDVNLEDLIDRYLNGELDDVDKEWLAFRLDSDAKARQEFVEFVNWDTEIRSALNQNASSASNLLPGEVGFRAFSKKDGSGKLSSSSLVLAVTIAFCLAIVVNQLMFRGDRKQQEPTELTPRQLPASIARVTGLNGDLIWTGDRGQIVRSPKVGMELAGGTIEGLAPDSWFELRFNDGSTVMISGSSLLTFGDDGQKVLRLREGHLSGKVSPQPKGKPMVVSTRSAVLNVLGTQFNMEANLSSTDLMVSEGSVRFKRFSDGKEVVVEAQHQVTSDHENGLLPIPVPRSAFNWKSRVDGQVGNYGQWKPATLDTPATLKAIPLVPAENPDVTLYLAGMSVNRSDGSPVVVMPHSQFVVRGKMRSESRVYFGIRVKHPNGEYAGMFRGDLKNQQPITKIDETGRFEAVYQLKQFTIDPVVVARRGGNASSPDGLVLDGVWAFTHTKDPSGLEIFDVELLPPSN